MNSCLEFVFLAGGFLQDGFQCFIAGLLYLPIALSFFIIALLTILLSFILLPIKLLMGLESSTWLFLPAAALFLLMLWAVHRFVTGAFNRVVFGNSPVVPLGLVRYAGRGRTGLKAQGLGLLRSAGFETPPGFVVSGLVHEKSVRRKGAGGSHESYSIPAAVKKKINRRLRKLNCVKVIIRSSFLDEDGEGRSMAGVYRSVAVDLAKENWEVPLAEVWASYFSDAAESERNRGRRVEPSLSLPVIVQERIEHDVFITACSANVLNGCTEEMIIDYEAREASGVICYNLLLRNYYSLSGPDEPPLLEKIITRLVDALQKLEAKCGGPVQIEAGLAGGRLHFYQVRLLTVLCPVETLVNSFVVDLIDVPLTPLSNSLFDLPGSIERLLRKRFAPFGLAAGELVLGEVAGRFYLRYNPVRPVLNRHHLARPRFALPSALSNLRVYARAVALGRMRRAASRLAGVLGGAAELSAGELRDRVLLPLFRMQFEMFSVANALGQHLEIFLRRVFPACEDIDSIVDSLKAPPSDTAYRRLLDAIEKMDTGNKQELEKFVMEFGHWGIPEAEVAAARVGDDPSAWLGRADASSGLIEKESADGEAEAKVEALFDEAWAGHILNPGKLLFRFLLNRYRAALRLRETTREQLNRTLFAIREKVREAGKGDDVFFATLDEVERDSFDGETIRKRKAEYEKNLKARKSAIVHIPEIPAAPRLEGNTIVCLGIGGGVAEGPALAPGGPAPVNPAEKPVLVLERPDGSYGPMLGGVSALVVERGSPLSHLVLLAREAGLPVLVGAEGARGRVRTGDRLAVDAGRGVLRIGG